MKYIIFTFFIISYYLIQNFGNAVEINILNYSFDNTDNYNETSIKGQFLKYAKEKDLNITINMEIMKFENPSDSLEMFKSLVESSLKKSNLIEKNNTNKYDMYFFDMKYIDIYGPYLLDLNKNLPKEHLDMYSSETIKDACSYKHKLVGLPTYVSYEILYSNSILLNKYKKPIPKTWDELMDTCKYIMERENDPELICYNGLFDDTDQGLYSIYNFVYSCRDSFNSSYPYIHDKSFVNSLELLKRLKETASNEIFRSNEKYTFSKMFGDKKAIFLKYWLIGDPLLSKIQETFQISMLPGIKEGISGSAVMGNSIGIIRNITESKREASLEVLKYFTSKEYQTKIILQRSCMTALTELLYDEEICKVALCDIFRDIQFTTEPKFIREGKNDYRKRYKKYIYQFLYENKTIGETLKQIEDITKIYCISIDTKDSYVGLIFFIFFSVISGLMLLSLIALLRDNFQPFFEFLPSDFWAITVLGSVMMLWSPYMNYGMVKTMNCHLKLVMVPVGITLNLGPSLYRLIIQFPEERKIIEWIKKHKYLYLLNFIFIDLLVCSLSLIHPYQPRSIFVEDGESFQVCKYNKEFSVIVLLLYKVLVILIALLLIFVEWNISTTMNDLRLIVLNIYINMFSIVVLYIIHIINVKRYTIYFILHTIITTTIAISDYMFLYGYQLLVAFIRKKDVKKEFISNINDKFINNETNNMDINADYSICKSNVMDEYNNNNNNNNSNNHEENESVMTNRTSFLTRMIDYHFVRETTNSHLINSSSMFTNLNK